MHRPLRPSTSAAAACLLALSVLTPAAHAADVGQPAPPFVLPGSDADTVSLAALKGKIVLLDFWASWCGPCRQSFPWMNEMQAKYGPRGLLVLAINVDRQRSAADVFLRLLPAHFTLAFDSSGDTPMLYGVRAMPTSLLIGADGRVLQQHAGFVEEDRPALEAAIVAALAVPR